MNLDPRISKRCRDYAMTKLAELHHDEYIRLNNKYRERSGLPMLNPQTNMPFHPYVYKVKDIPR